MEWHCIEETHPTQASISYLRILDYAKLSWKIPEYNYINVTRPDPFQTLLD